MTDAAEPDLIEARTVFEYHVRQLGAPRRRAIAGEGSDAATLHVEFPESHNWHPVFAFTHAFSGEGYTQNRFTGEHQSVPLWSESSAFGVLETSSHKGETFVQFLDWPDAEAAVGKVTRELAEPDAPATHYEAARVQLFAGYGIQAP